MLTPTPSSIVNDQTCKLTYCMNIGERIKEARAAAGYGTTVAFAKQVKYVLTKWGYKGVSRVAVTSWETGTTKNVRPENLAAISEVTGFSMKWIAIGKGAKVEAHNSTVLFSNDDRMAAKYSDETLRLAKQIEALPPTARNVVQQLLEELRSKKANGG